MPNPDEKDIVDETAELVERLRERAAIARGEKTGTALGDAIHFEEAADEIERLTSQGGVPEGQFLLERLSEVEFSGCDEEFVRDWLGHVEPAIERFRSALAAAPSPPVQQSRAVNVPGGQWHDISTAPKDGSKILAWDGDYVIVRADPNGGWSDDFQQYLRLDKWMPLPAPPMLEAPINAVPKPEGE
jgi:hypothetical protein